MNPFISGLFRAQQIQAAERANAIRLDMAMNTGYLNPQAGMLTLSGIPAYATGYGASYTPALSVPVPAGVLQTAIGPEAYQAFADYKSRQSLNSVLAQAYQAFRSRSF